MGKPKPRKPRIRMRRKEKEEERREFSFFSMEHICLSVNFEFGIFSEMSDAKKEMLKEDDTLRETKSIGKKKKKQENT
ncbi:hypothetical protein B9Z55_015362 [Caenorhabditis nigoni]|nr:hypothetical protein B9Z55_015362 [Caenorhabditis nigoni]